MCSQLTYQYLYSSSTISSTRGVEGAHSRVHLSVFQSGHTPHVLDTDIFCFVGVGGGGREGGAGGGEGELFMCGNSCKGKLRAPNIVFSCLAF